MCIRDSIYAYTICRLDIGYVVTKLARYSQAPAEIHYLALKRICRYLRQTRDWGIMYWRPKPILSLPKGSDERLCNDPTSDLPAFPSTANPLTLIRYIDAAHATDLPTQ